MLLIPVPLLYTIIKGDKHNVTVAMATNNKCPFLLKYIVVNFLVIFETLHLMKCEMVN